MIYLAASLAQEEPKSFDDPKVLVEISAKLEHFLQNFRQGQSLTSCCDHVNARIRLEKKLCPEELQKMLAFLPNVELQDSGKQMWAKLRCEQACIIE